MDIMGLMERWWKIVLAVVLVILVIYLLSSSYEYYENYQQRKTDQYDELEVKLYDEIFDFKKLYQIDTDSIYNFLKTRTSLDEEKTKVLDAGSGVGRHYLGLSKHFEVVGVDRSRNMLDMSRVRNPLGEFKYGNLEDGDLFSAGEFKAIVCLMETLHQNDSSTIDQILTNFHRWLKPGGYLFLHIFDPKELDPGPREFTQYYTDGDTKHALTYFNDFTHDAWWEKAGNGLYQYCQKYIIENGKSKLKKQQLYIPAVKEMIQKVLDHDFKLVGVKDLEKAHIDSFKMYVFSKK